MQIYRCFKGRFHIRKVSNLGSRQRPICIRDSWLRHVASLHVGPGGHYNYWLGSCNIGIQTVAVLAYDGIHVGRIAGGWRRVNLDIDAHVINLVVLGCLLYLVITTLFT